MNNRTLYSKRMKLADILAADGRLLSIVQRLDIRLGFGESTVDEICSQYGLSTDLFLVICNIYSFHDYVPELDALRKTDIEHITGYLRASHRYYRTVCFPGIHRSIHMLVKDLDDVNRRLIDKFYDDYDNEVTNHFQYEESTVFPYIESLLHNKQTKCNEFRISKFEKNHSNINEKLNDLKNIIMKYLPGEYSSPLLFEILSDIYAVEKDLLLHSLIEDKLLIPLVEKFENHHE